LAKGDPLAHAKEATPLIAQLSHDDKVHLLWALVADLNVTPETPIESPRRARQSHDPSHDTTDTVRVRDDDMPADCWDADTGTFRPRPATHMPIKAAAQAWVKAALQGVKGQRNNEQYDA
jgi:hypothetical protein